ncbi:unnamed protein product [Prorocentrum cordatum]|uniref:Alpha/beta hydrolase fold-3 domain-containing protein n=1 Tax=Prorocentrum cordatum TaxID=2364126 RepID=A0ABN9SQB5_9DINO|nr:unnamed protein product [Polarella glacialis]
MRRMSVTVPRDLVALQRLTDFAESLPQFRQAYLSIGDTTVQACDAAAELGDGEWLWARGAASPAECPGLPEEQRRMVLYVHGGAFVLCNAATHRSLTLHVARATRAPVLVVHYRRPPQDPYPAALDDVVHAYRQVICTFPPQRVLVAGESAGGNLAVALCLRLSQMGLPLPGGLVLMSPWVDLSDFSSPSWHGQSDYLPADLAEHFAHAYVGQALATDELVSPSLSCSLGVLPRSLLIYGSVESIADQNALFGKRLRQAGVSVTEYVADGMVHAFPVFSDFAYGHLSQAVIFVTAVAAGAVIGLLVFAVDLALGMGPRRAAIVGASVTLCVVVAARVRSCGYSPRDFLEGERSPTREGSDTDGSGSSGGSSEAGPAALPAPLRVFQAIGAFSREVWGVPASGSPG